MLPRCSSSTVPRLPTSSRGDKPDLRRISIDDLFIFFDKRNKPRIPPLLALIDNNAYNYNEFRL